MPQKENCCLDLCSFFWASLLLGVLVPQVLAVWAASNSSFCVPDPMNGSQLCCLLLLAATVSLLGLLPYTKSQLMPTGEKQYAERWAQLSGLSLLSRTSLLTSGASAAI